MYCVCLWWDSFVGAEIRPGPLKAITQIYQKYPAVLHHCNGHCFIRIHSKLEPCEWYEDLRFWKWLNARHSRLKFRVKIIFHGSVSGDDVLRRNDYENRMEQRKRQWTEEGENWEKKKRGKTGTIRMKGDGQIKKYEIMSFNMAFTLLRISKP